MLLMLSKVLVKALTREANGHGVARYLSVLERILLDGEVKPALFEDPTYIRSKADVVTTDCLETDLLECGLAVSEPNSLWIHFQPLDDK